MIHGSDPKGVHSLAKVTEVSRHPVRSLFLVLLSYGSPRKHALVSSTGGFFSPKKGSPRILVFTRTKNQEQDSGQNIWPDFVNFMTQGKCKFHAPGMAASKTLWKACSSNKFVRHHVFESKLQPLVKVGPWLREWLSLHCVAFSILLYLKIIFKVKNKDDYVKAKLGEHCIRREFHK